MFKYLASKSCLIAGSDFSTKAQVMSSKRTKIPWSRECSIHDGVRNTFKPGTVNRAFGSGWMDHFFSFLMVGLFDSNLCKKYGDIAHPDSVRTCDMCFKDRSSPKSTIDWLLKSQVQTLQGLRVFEDAYIPVTQLAKSFSSQMMKGTRTWTNMTVLGVVKGSG